MTIVRRERGQVVVIFALLLPVVLVIGSVVLSVGNWFVHKRHLQTQVDAAVLATGQDFVGCYLNKPATNTLVKNTALRYAGDTQRDPLTTNLQVQEPNDVRVVLNSSGYWSAAQAGMDPATGYTLDWSLDGDAATPGRQSSQPCDARFIDAKATDDRLPLLWRWIPLFPSAKTQATLEIHELPGLAGFLPWAVPEAAPRTVAALFVDQNATTNQGVPSDVLVLTGPPDPSVTTPRNGENVALWSANGAASITDSTGVVILSSRQLLTAMQLQGRRLDDICNLNATACYGAVKAGSVLIATNKTGVGFIHGKPQTDGTGNKTATVTDVELTTLKSNNKPNGGLPCIDDTAPYFVWTQTDCDVRIRAQVDFGSAILSSGAREVRVSTSAFGNKCNGGISLQKTVQNGLLWWEQEANWTTLRAGSGQTNFYLCWNGESDKPGPRGGTNPEGGVFGDRVQQMAFAASTDAKSGAVFSGPIASLTVLPNSSPKNSQGVSVAVGLLPPLSISDGNATPIFLRIAGTGSLNQALQCDKQLQLEDMVRDGCKTPYQVNTRNLVCDPYTPSNLPPDLPPPDPDPWPDCIQAKTGDVTAMSKGLHQRFEAPPPPKVPCPPNKWKDYRSRGEVPPGTDPRFVTLVVAEYGTFDDQGNKVLPITKFAGFYATGWFTKNSPSMSQGCVDNDPPPPCPDPDNPSGPLCDPAETRYQGAVWGYFVKQVFPSPQRPGTTLCVFNQVGICSADLVK